MVEDDAAMGAVFRARGRRVGGAGSLAIPRRLVIAPGTGRPTKASASGTAYDAATVLED